MIHNEKSKYAGKVVKIKTNAKHPQVTSFGGADYNVEDWWDIVSGKSWMACNGNPACLVFAMRAGFGGLPTDDEVLYGKIGNYGHLVHISEIQEAMELCREDKKENEC